MAPRPRNKSLGLLELVAIALGGMVGGGIFTILGISADMVGYWTPVAIALGGGVAALAAYSYVKLGVLYRDEGATYAFMKRSFPSSSVAAAIVGWTVIFGYISTLALYAYTFAAYAAGAIEFEHPDLARSGIAALVLLLFAVINLVSVRGMGRIEDLLVYTKLIVLAFIATVLVAHGDVSELAELRVHEVSAGAILTVASITFVAYEGFQLVINAVNEMENPERNIPRAIYLAILLVVLIYVGIAIAALAAIPLEDLARSKEDALAAGAADAIGVWGRRLVVFGAILATSSAISGTVFGSSRQMAAIADDGFFPRWLSRRGSDGIPRVAIVTMTLTAILLIFSGGLRLILEFGSITFLLVSFLTAYANHHVRERSGAHTSLTVGAMVGLGVATVLILVYEATHQPEQLVFILAVYALLAVGAIAYGRRRSR